METAFLPVTREEMLERGWDRVDFAFVSGDAYVDQHPSSGMAIITRWRRTATSGRHRPA